LLEFPNKIKKVSMVKHIYSVPNLLSLLRLVLVPVLVVVAFFGQVNLFLILLGISLLSDLLDGYFARKLNQVTDLGARLDSFADLATYAIMIVGLYLVWPQIFIQQKPFLFAAMLSYMLPQILAFIRFGSLPSYHTWGAKLAAVFIAPAYYLLIITGNQLFFRGVILFHIFVAIEEVAITIILKQAKTNVGSIVSLLGSKKNKLQ